MRARTVIALRPDATHGIVVTLERAPLNIEGARLAHPLACDPDTMGDWSAAGAVRTHGETLRQALDRQPAIRQALELLEGVAPPDVRPLYFRIEVDDAERLCWETLVDRRGRFLCFDRRWPIARMADLVVDRPEPEREFVAPLRLMVVLSALGIDARPEWIAIRDAVLGARDAGLGIALRVVVGEEALREAIVAEALEGVTVAPLTRRSTELVDAIDAFEPHLLHFFCHGSTSHGVGRLELATASDHLAGLTSGSVQLTIEDLLAAPAFLDSVWLVTLNCCEGGKAIEELFSMTHRLVAAGVPAALGMLEPIDAGDANELCRAFYLSLLEGVRASAKAGSASGKPVTLELVDALRVARLGLRDRHGNDPPNTREWTLPVLYVRPERLRVHVRAGDGGAAALEPAARERLALVAAFLRALPPQERTDSVRAEALALLGDVPEGLRPDADGRLAGEEDGR